MTTSARKRTPFLTAHWRWLVMLNYEVDPDILRVDVPVGTELDIFNGQCLVSIVGFMFDRSKLFGTLPIPFHRSFEEVNLRFYVKREVEGEWRRGVVFIKELVPSRSVTFVARTVFHENYERVPMNHEFRWNNDLHHEQGGRFEYAWRHQKQPAKVWAETSGVLQPLTPGSLPEFITEHYWGYSRTPTGTTLEYQVEHPAWRTWEVGNCGFEANVANLYGEKFAEPLSREPHSAMVAEGSPVVLHLGRQLNSARPVFPSGNSRLN